MYDQGQEHYSWADTLSLQERMNCQCEEGRRYLRRLDRMEQYDVGNLGVHLYYADLCIFWQELLELRCKRDAAASVERRVKYLRGILEADGE